VSSLSPKTVLRRAPELRVHIASGATQVLGPGDPLALGRHGLAVLDAFSYPISLSEALGRLQTRAASVHDAVELMNTIMRLYSAGILQDETQDEPMAGADEATYDAAPIHVAMLNDRKRTEAFLAGIQEVVRPGDVVVDIGTGTGILAMAAARAGARHVYAIEASGIGRCARALFEVNGLADRITLLREHSTRVSLPERADVLVSEMVGNEPLREQVLEVTLDARQRLLKPDARLVPRRLRVLGLPVAIPGAELARRTFTPEVLQTWRGWYGIDFDPLAEFGRPLRFFVSPYAARAWTILSEPVVLADVDLQSAIRQVIDSTATATATASGRLDGVVVYFDLELGPTTRLSTHPAASDQSVHWRSPVWVVDGPPVTVRPGDRLNITYKYNVQPSGVTVARI